MHFLDFYTHAFLDPAAVIAGQAILAAGGGAPEPIVWETVAFNNIGGEGGAMSRFQSLFVVIEKKHALKKEKFYSIFSADCDSFS